VNDVVAWLERETRDAPESLRARILAAVNRDTNESVQNLLAAAAFNCLRSAAAHPEHAAQDLLCADALLTHACAAAAAESDAELERFTAACDAYLFQQLHPA
jgi:hypothetical protein